MTTVFAHRGASVAEPENTIAAFLAAKAMGADGVELDVRRHQSGVLAVAHDEVLGADLSPSVPDLASALDACEGMTVNIEIKNWRGDGDHDPSESLAERVVSLLHERGGRDDVLVSSFSLATIERVRSLDPSIRTGFLVMIAPDRDVAGRALQRCREGGHVALHPHHSAVTAELVERCHGAGVAVNTWTVDDPDRMRALAAMGVDAIITNVPDIARSTLRPPQ